MTIDELIKEVELNSSSKSLEEDTSKESFDINTEDLLEGDFSIDKMAHYLMSLAKKEESSFELTPVEKVAEALAIINSFQKLSNKEGSE